MLLSTEDASGDDKPRLTIYAGQLQETALLFHEAAHAHALDQRALHP